MERSCEVYDEGYTDEAIQIAVRIRGILHPGGKRSKSLLQHLLTGRIPLLTTSEGAPESKDILLYDGMTSFRVISDGNSVSSFAGPSEDNALHQEYIKAGGWWKQVVLVAEGTRYSRRDIVLGVANQEGGAMVRKLADDMALKTPRGTTKRIYFDYSLGEDFGQNTLLGPLTHQEKDLHYHTLHYCTNWVQIDWASWVHLDRWRDGDRAREDARLGLDLPLRGLY